MAKQRREKKGKPLQGSQVNPWSAKKLEPETIVGMVHDINNLLAPASNFSRHMSQRGDIRELEDKDLEILMAMASSSADSLSKARQLLKDMMEFLSPGMNEPEKLDLRSILQTNVHTAQMSTSIGGSYSKFNFKLSIDGDLPSIMGDPNSLDRAFDNLLINALHAMPEGGELKVEVMANGGSSVVIRITDTGSGMDEDTIAKVFQPFFTTKGNEGNGLGLAIVGKVVEAHGGTIEVKSELGKGTTFEIILPTNV